MTHSVTYGITEEHYTLENTVRCSYGIAAYVDADIDGTATILLSIRDISSDREKLSQLVRECNRSKLSVVHLGDVVDDFLSD